MVRFRTLFIAAAALIGITGMVVTSQTRATEAAYTFAGEPEIVAATFSSNWCSSCKVLEPRLSKVMPEFSDKPVKFVELDFTFGEGSELAEKARSEGLGDIYPRFKGATGFTLLVDRNTGDIIDMLTISHSEKAMRAAIAQALATATRNSAAH